MGRKRKGKGTGREGGGKERGREGRKERSEELNLGKVEENGKSETGNPKEGRRKHIS